VTDLSPVVKRAYEALVVFSVGQAQEGSSWQLMSLMSRNSQGMRVLKGRKELALMGQLGNLMEVLSRGKNRMS